MTTPTPAAPPAAAAQTKSIVVDHVLPHSPQKVWRALTEPELLARWLMPNDIRPEVGHRFTFQTQPAPGFDGIAHCEVLEVVPERTIRYTFRGGAKEVEGYGHFIDTVIAWSLTPTPDGGTILHLEHSGFTPDAEMPFRMMRQGWEMPPTRLEAVLESLA